MTEKKEAKGGRRRFLSACPPHTAPVNSTTEFREIKKINETEKIRRKKEEKDFSFAHVQIKQ